MAKTVIDVSAWQGDIDFQKVKESGVSAVIIRAGYGKNNIDPMFKTYIERAITAGLPVGIYWFSYAYTTEMAEKEAEYCIEAIKPYKVTLPVFFDWEYDSANYFEKMLKRSATKQEVTAMYSAFMGKVLVEDYKAGYYTNPDYLARLIDESKIEINGYYKWLAFYTSVEQTDCDIWQYGADYIDGCSVKVDMNKLINESLLKETSPSDDKPTETSLKPGDVVKIKDGAYYYATDTKVPSVIIGKEWIVYSVNGNRVVLNKSVDGINSIMSAFKASDLVFVSDGRENLKIGDIVRMSKDAVVYGTSQKFAPFIYGCSLFVRSINGDKILVSIYRDGDVTGYVDRKYLTKV